MRHRRRRAPPLPWRGDAARANALPAYLGTATLARSATESAGPALLVVAIATLGNATTGSYLVASLTASAAIGGPVVGALIDRARSPRRGFALAMAVMAAGLAAIALSIGQVPVGVVMVIAVLAGLGYPALTGAWSAQLPKLVPRQRITHAYSADAATYSVAAVVAPPIATALVALSATAPLWLPVLLLRPGRRAAAHRAPAHARRTRSIARPLGQDLRAGLGAIAGMPPCAGPRSSRRSASPGRPPSSSPPRSSPSRSAGSLGFTGVILGVFAGGRRLHGAVVHTATRCPTRPRHHRQHRSCRASRSPPSASPRRRGCSCVAAFAMGATEPPLVSAMFQVRVRESPARVQSQVFTTSASLRMTAFAIATAMCGWLLHVGVGAVIAFGVALHVVSLVLGLVLGPAPAAAAALAARDR